MRWRKLSPAQIYIFGATWLCYCSRGVDHSLEISGNPYRKSKISYAKCWFTPRFYNVRENGLLLFSLHPASGNCTELDHIDGDGFPHTHTPCEGPATVHVGRHHCCKGYCMDLLAELSEKLNFTFSLRLVEDGEFSLLCSPYLSDVKIHGALRGVNNSQKIPKNPNISRKIAKNL